MAGFYVPGTDETDLKKIIMSLQLLAGASSSIREKLSAARTYYVRTDGIDSNNGLTNTSSGAFLTIQKAIDAVAGLDIGTNNVTIQVADGTYTAGCTVNGPWVGTGVVTLQGNAATPASCIIAAVTTNNIFVENSARLSVVGFKLTNSSNYLMQALAGNITVTGSMEFGACTAMQVRSVFAGSISFNAGINYTISGGSGYHFFCGSSSLISVEGVNAITVTGTPAFGTAFAFAGFGGQIIADGMGSPPSGAATGKRYDVSTNAVIYTAGGGANFFPGNVAGTDDGYGVYI